MTEYDLAVAVCTFRRTRQLTELIGTIDEIAPAELPGRQLVVIVVDDSPEADAAGLVDTLRASVSIDLVYSHTGSADISSARNRALQLGRSSAPLLAFIDDDCTPQMGWLSASVEMAERSGADIVVGHRQFVPGNEAPHWLKTQPFIDENLVVEDGSDPDLGNTANVLFRSEFLRRTEAQFRADLGRSGGEDMVFFADARAAGAVIRFAAGSVVLEPYEDSRASYRYQLWRQLWLGNNEAAINRRTRQVPRRRLAARGAKRVLAAVGHPVGRIVRGKAPQCHWALAWATRGLGLLLGVAGLELHHRS